MRSDAHARARLPLSGDVQQAFRFWAKSFSQQTGFININNVASSNPGIEKKIIEDVAGYGKQIGWIIEALDLVLRKLKLDGLPAELSEEDRKTVVRLDDLMDRIEAIKKEKG